MEKPKYITAQKIEEVFGVKAKTILNRSNLQPTERTYIPSVRFEGSRRKYFNTKMIGRLFNTTSLNVEGGSNE